MTMASLTGRKALVTGASSGIGRAIARAFAENGAAVAVGGRDSDRVQRTCQEVEGVGALAVAVLGDVSDVAQAERVVDEAASGLGGLDIVVNNAGIDVGDWCKVHEWPVDSFDEVIAVNLRGPFLVSKYAIPHLLKNDRSSMLHISSVCAITVWEGDCACDMSKAALNMLSDHIAVEYGAQGIVSTTLMPGVIRTELHERVMEDMGDGRAFERELVGRHPIGRFGTVEEVADAAVFLCSNQAPFLTGANISIDGGYSRV